jgi:uncharacterized membrane protein
MNKTRLEAFSDGVIAIIITIMVLELKPPHGTSWETIKPLIPQLVSYVISFCIIGIYWGNHHHLLHTVANVSSGLIWANMHLLFWLSLIPFSTAWIGENDFSSATLAIYGGLQAMTGLAYYILLKVVQRTIPAKSPFLIVLKMQERKGLMSFFAFSLSVPLAFVHPAFPVALVAIVAIIWWIPDKNIEKVVGEAE